MPSIDYLGNEIFYDDQGEGHPLLFMHGLAADRTQSNQIVGGLHNIRAITIDMLGHGESLINSDREIAEQTGFQNYTDVALAVLGHLKIERCFIGGISMGAGISMRLAIDHPELVQAMFLVRPAWLNRAAHPHLSIIEDIGNWIASHGAEVAMNKLLANESYQQLERENPLAAHSVKGAITRDQAGTAAMVLPHLVQDSPFNRLSSVNNCLVPAIVVGNNADPLHPPLIAREIHGALPNSKYVHAPPKYLAPEEHLSVVQDVISTEINERSQIKAAQKA